MGPKEYYTAPSDEVFNDIKEQAIEIWRTYDDTYGYASEKVNKIRHLKNIEDNAWYIVSMFDYQNQAKLISMVKPKTAEMIKLARGDQYYE